MIFRRTIHLIVGSLLIFVACEDKKDPRFEILFEPLEFQYGKVEVSQTVSQKIRVKNTDKSSEAFIGEIIILDSPAFIMDFSGVLTLQKNESKEIYITFRPTSAQKYNEKISVSKDYAFSEMYLYGEGVAPVSFSLDQTKLEFGMVKSGETKDLDLIFTNNASSGFDLELALSIPSSDFSVIGGNNSLTIAPGLSQTVSISFTPTLASSTKSLKVTHNSSVQSNPLNIQLTGIMDESSIIMSKISEGWTQFENKNYNDSRKKFQDAMNKARIHATYDSVYGEAMYGRGWGTLFDQSMNDHGKGAFIDFVNVINDYGSKISGRSKLDCLAGKAISGALIGGSVEVYDTVVSAALDLLNQDQNYQFIHKTSVDHKDVRMALIQSYYYLGKYTEAAAQMNILDPSNSPHSTNPATLLAAIQALSGSL